MKHHFEKCQAKVQAGEECVEKLCIPPPCSPAFVLLLLFDAGSSTPLTLRRLVLIAKPTYLQPDTLLRGLRRAAALHPGLLPMTADQNRSAAQMQVVDV
ncbi:hypothetical protein DFH09DRAFT_1335942 [Mycena vulgaris]|nr:hypothetical protein DFH09DRAFT_1335942 [Mycena vulgaris]